MIAMAMESLRLWLALTPKQFEDLNNGKGIHLTITPNVLGYEKTRWLPLNVRSISSEGRKGEFCALVEVELTAIGYFQKAEAGILLKYITHRRFCTQKLLHTDSFTYTQKFLRTEPFTLAFTQRRFYTKALLHTDAFTHRLLYT